MWAARRRVRATRAADVVAAVGTALTGTRED